MCYLLLLYLLDGLITLSFYNHFLLSLVTTFGLKYFVRWKYSYSHLFWFPIIWNKIFHPFTLTVYLSLNLKCISLIVWCHFKNSFSHSMPFNGEIHPLKFRVIIDMWDLLMSICFHVLYFHYFFSCLSQSDSLIG